MGYSGGMFNRNGVSINVTRLAAGFYEMIPDDDKVCMSLGMLPANWMDLFEKLLVRKLALLSIPSLDDEQLQSVVDKGAIAFKVGDDDFEFKLDSILVKDIMHSVCCELLKKATDDGLCVV